MTAGLFSKKKSSNIARSRGFALPKIISQIFNFFLAKKTILFVTNQKIRSITLGTITQICLILFFTWVGNLFIQSIRYDNILAAKNGEINRLETVNNFFGDEIDNVNDKLVKIREYLSAIVSSNDNEAQQKDPEQPNLNGAGFSKKDQKTFSKIGTAEYQISDIQLTAQKRIKKIESVITVTGLNIKKIPAKLHQNNEAATKQIASKSSNESSKGQGGPLAEDELMNSTTSQAIQEYDLGKELEKAKFTSEIDYLIVLEKLVNIVPFGKPMKNYYISSSFGSRRDPLTGRTAKHRGLDFVGAKKEEIISPSNGKVILAGRYNDYGNAVVIDHGFGITTRYGHLSELKVKKGQIVQPGEIIALQGSTGRSTGPHLHYEVRYKNKPLNPRKFLEAGEFLSNDQKT